jgi:hypothetical protein
MDSPPLKRLDDDDGHRETEDPQAPENQKQQKDKFHKVFSHLQTTQCVPGAQAEVERRTYAPPVVGDSCRTGRAENDHGDRLVD